MPIRESLEFIQSHYSPIYKEEFAFAVRFTSDWNNDLRRNFSSHFGKLYTSEQECIIAFKNLLGDDYLESGRIRCFDNLWSLEDTRNGSGLSFHGYIPSSEMALEFAKTNEYEVNSKYEIKIDANSIEYYYLLSKENTVCGLDAYIIAYREQETYLIKRFKI